MNPFVQALKESEGKGKGRAQEWDDLEDFIVCKPGRDYRRMLGLDEHARALRPPRPRPSLGRARQKTIPCGVILPLSRGINHLDNDSMSVPENNWLSFGWDARQT